MYEQTSDIMRAIGVYTEQIERYENLSTWFAAFVAGSILVVLIFAASLVLRQKKDGGQVLCNGILSGMFAVVPVLVTLYLYTFAMNMRKVALYRGYLCVLERQWNDLYGGNVMQFNDRVMERFYSVQSFPVNGLGPAVMAFFVVLALVLGFAMSIYFLRRLPESRVKSTAKILLGAVMVVCVLFNGLCVYYLSVNDAVTANVIACCAETVK